MAPFVLTLGRAARPAWSMPLAPCELEAVLTAMLAVAGVFDAEADLALLDDAAMEALHAGSLGCAGPTNVLAFPEPSLAPGVSGAATMPDSRAFSPGHAFAPQNPGATPLPLDPAFPAQSPGAARMLGSLALSVDTLERECFLYGQEPLEHCIRLLAHALAHLLGHDHGPAMSALAERMESAALERLRFLKLL